MSALTSLNRAAGTFDVNTASLTGRWLVEASAGTGKTYALERIVLRLVIEKAVAIDRVLLVTFTNAATAELRERVRALFYRAAAALRSEDRTSEFEGMFENSRAAGHNAAALLQSALEQFDEASILTIHGFCQKMLSEFIFTRGGAYDVEFSGNTGLTERVVEEFLRRELPALTPEQRSAVLQWESLTKLLNKLCELGPSVKVHLSADSKDTEDPELQALFERFINEAPKRVAELERIEGVKSFSALLTDMYELVQNDPAAAERIRSRYDAVLIDEFQDTDRVQYRIFQNLFLQDVPTAPESVFFVGDPKQAIYAFRGAELSVYLQARNDIESMKGLAGLKTLDTNYRSTPALVGAVNAFFSPSTDEGSFQTPDIRYEDLKTGASSLPLLRIEGKKASVVPVMSLWMDDGSLAGHKMDEVKRAEADKMADDVASLLDGTVYLFRHGLWRPLKPGDIAILVQKRVQADEVISRLLSRGIRTLIDDQSSVFKTTEAKDIRMVLAAMLSPTDAKQFAAARATRLIGRTLSEMREKLETAAEDRELLKTAAERLQVNGPAAAIACIAQARRLAERLLPVKGGAERLMNYEHLSELLQGEYRRLGSAGALLRVMQRLKSVDTPPDEHKVRKPSDENVVRIVTVHASKGLEYPVVYLVQAEGMKAGTKDNKAFWMPGSGHDSDVTAAPKLDEDTTGQSARRLLCERLRLAYVAMTRASSRLVLPIFTSSAKQGGSCWKSTRNAYLQAMTGLEAPAEKLTDYEEILDRICSAFESVRERFESAAHAHPELSSLAAVRETLAAQFKDVKLVDADALDQPFVEIRTCADAAESVVGAADRQFVQALDPVRLTSAWHRSSFTAIAANLGAPVGEEFEAEEFEGADAVIEINEEAGIPAAASVEKVVETPTVDKDEAIAQAEAFLRGAAAGDWMHKLFERVMNAQPALRDEVLEGIKPALAASALLRRADPDRREAVLEAGTDLIERYVKNTIHCEFFNAATFGAADDGKGAFELNELTGRDHICEMPFLLSVHNRTLFARSVAQCMTENGFAMESLRESALSGYLTGAIDMVFSARGKYYILDWKSNWLGDKPEDYSQEAMRAEIDRKHYALQYVIYLTALKRHLIAVGAADESDVWDRIGGVFYVFIRGTDAQAALDNQGRRTGVYFDCPRKAVDALDALLKGN